MSGTRVPLGQRGQDCQWSGVTQRQGKSETPGPPSTDTDVRTNNTGDRDTDGVSFRFPPDQLS